MRLSSVVKNNEENLNDIYNDLKTINISEYCLMKSKYSNCTIGSQMKIYKDGIYYKVDEGYSASTSEVIVSLFLSCINNLDIPYCKYYPIVINEMNGCYSYEYCSKNSDVKTFETIVKTYCNRLGISYDMLEDKDKLNVINKSVTEYTEDYSVSEYLNKIFVLDTVICNIDRHLANLETYDKKLSPIFDNGLGLLSFRRNLNSYTTNRLTSNPITKTFEERLKLIDPIVLDIDMVKFNDIFNCNKIENERLLFSVEFLRQQLDRYNGSLISKE